MKSKTKLILFLVFLVFAFSVSRIGPWANHLTMENITQHLMPIRDTWWAPLVFIGIYILGCILALPSFGLSVMGGVLFGFGKGFLYNWVAINIGAALAFGVGRSLGREQVKKMLQGDRIKSLERSLHEHGVKVIIALRILPILPFNVVNYASAVFHVKLRHYLIGSFIGMFPATLAFTYFADVMSLGERDFRLEITIALIVLAGIIAGIVFLPKKLRKTSSKSQ